MKKYYIWHPAMSRRSSLTVVEANSREEARRKAEVNKNYSVQTYDELPQFIKNMLPNGADNDIDKDNNPVKAHVVYWTADFTIINQVTIHAETVYPLSLVTAITSFRPENAAGCNVNFEYFDGKRSITNVFTF